MTTSAPLAPATITKLKRRLQERRESIARTAESFHNEALGAMKTRDVSDVMDTDQPDSAGGEDSMLMATMADKIVVDIDDALARIEAGAYGYCEACRKRIPFVRLLAIPEARLCVDCKQGERR